ncbi:hypothetical protein CROQUDRAFT_658479 [Cronartium quercuum f. sp. fusiforme G11]|uniref:CUE domain-containing protein n=1 Tax=Cronartium quercuum f. sp. fusiforme G11 TaxID=708437 RepID=A0A9P6NL72_9BASI|nr:hypothetical protein CROQUDRAFT_658479 [Cronartium quercuum f. sp. fusiforme G11]
MSEDLLSVLAAIGIIALVYRWFTTSPTTTSAANGAGRSQTALQRRAMAISQTQVERLRTTFPQLTEHEIRYALVTTAGGVEAVAERVLVHGGLPPPPPNFFPPAPTSTRPATPVSNTSSSGTPTVVPSQPGSKSTLASSQSTLISRLCLGPYKRQQDLAIAEHRDWSWEESRVEMERLQAQDGAGASPDQSSGVLRDRKAKMVLESRWRLLQKERKGKSTAPL